MADAIFGGEFQSRVTCHVCGQHSTVHEPFLDLSLPIPLKMLSDKIRKQLQEIEEENQRIMAKQRAKYLKQLEQKKKGGNKGNNSAADQSAESNNGGADKKRPEPPKTLGKKARKKWMREQEALREAQEKADAEAATTTVAQPAEANPAPTATDATGTVAAAAEEKPLAEATQVATTDQPTKAPATKVPTTEATNPTPTEPSKREEIAPEIAEKSAEQEPANEDAQATNLGTPDLNVFWSCHLASPIWQTQLRRRTRNRPPNLRAPMNHSRMLPPIFK